MTAIGQIASIRQPTTAQTLVPPHRSPVDPGTTSSAGSGTARSALPAVIARCAGGADVGQPCASHANRSTGRRPQRRPQLPGLSVCDDGIVIDLSPMKGIRVDPEARQSAAGALLSDLDRETQEFGLAVPAGVVAYGRRRANPWRRHRLAQARTDDRPTLAVDPSLPTIIRESERDRKRRALLGIARWRRQLRHRLSSSSA